MDTGNRRGSDRSPISQINVTPLVDVMLVLLIIFMVTASVGQQGITVSLPRAKSQALDVSEEIVTVTIDKSLQVYVNSRPVALGELGDTLRQVYAHRKNKSIFLKSDSSVAYGDFIKVVSLIKDSGVEQLGMITEMPKR
jgi:biopolymer transport protein TolR